MLREIEPKIETIFKSLFEQSKDAMYTTSRNGHIVIINKAGLALFGFSAQEMIGMDIQSLYVNPQERTAFQKEIEAKGAVTEYEVKLRRKNGTEIDCLLSSSLWHAEDGTIAGYQGIIRDITLYKRAESAQHQSEERLMSFMESATDYFMLFDSNLNLTMINKAAQNIFSPSGENLIGKNILEINPRVKDFGRYEKYLQVIETGQPIELENVVSAISGKIYINIRAFKVGDGLGLISTDITARKHMEEKLYSLQQKLRSLASRLSLNSEREKRRFAVSVHDHISQPLAVIKIKLSALRDQNLSEAIIPQIHELLETVNKTIQNSRLLTFDLSPPVLYELGLEAALEWFLEDCQRKYDIQCELIDNKKYKPIGEDVRSVLFRTARELVTNAIKHSETKSLTVSINGNNRELNLIVKDEGIGFNLPTVMKTTRGFGLFSIREEIRPFAGRMLIESKLGQGTQVTITMPLEHTSQKRSRKIVQ